MRHYFKHYNTTFLISVDQIFNADIRDKTEKALMTFFHGFLKSDKDNVDLLMSDAKNNQKLTINLFDKEIIRHDDSKISFEIDEHRRHNLLNGLDEISLTLENADKISNFESKLSLEKPWI